MVNTFIEQRLAGLLDQLQAVHRAGVDMSSASKGAERAAFLNSFLSKVLPPVFRFGDGDVTDSFGQRSGQLDLVIEYPFCPSLPVVGGGQTRLYLAEGVAAVIEVKSDLTGQWGEALETAKKVAPLERSLSAHLVIGNQPSLDRIPFFVVGYTGWKTVETVIERIQDGPVDGVLVIDLGIFVSKGDFGELRLMGPWALWGLIHCLNLSTSSLRAAGVQLSRYAH
jgi:hypothetical protein